MQNIVRWRRLRTPARSPTIATQVKIVAVFTAPAPTRKLSCAAEVAGDTPVAIVGGNGVEGGGAIFRRGEAGS